MPDLVHDIRRADAVRMRVRFLINTVERCQDGMERNFGRLSGQLMPAEGTAGAPD
jgi:hypothetical protein